MTVKDFVGGTIKAEFEDEGVVTDVSAGGRVPENATLKIYEPVLDEGYELVYVSLNGSDIKDQFKRWYLFADDERRCDACCKSQRNR